LTGAFLAIIGDAIAQKYIEKSKTLNKQRAIVVSSYGFLETVIEGQYWFNFLEKLVGKQVTLKNALFKTILDMIIFGPFEIILFMFWTNYLENSPKPLKEKVREDFFIILFNSYILWVPTSFLCFYVVPIKFRALYMCLVSVSWDTYMSFAAHNSAADLIVKASSSE